TGRCDPGPLLGGILPYWKQWVTSLQLQAHRVTHQTWPTRHPNTIEEQPDILVRLDRVFANFWCNLEKRMHQSAQRQSNDCSTSTAIPKQATDIRSPSEDEGPKIA
ncbi:Hypothetical predicted protein, partial [Pelobates cultripes]